jgi:hypothetical protein
MFEKMRRHDSRVVKALKKKTADPMEHCIINTNEGRQQS